MSFSIKKQGEVVVVDVEGQLIVGNRQELKQKVLPSIASGESMISYALSEREAGSDTVSMRTRAQQDGDDWVLNGTKAWITNGGVSDWYTVVAKTDPDKGHDGITLFIVDIRDKDGKEVEGFSVSRKLEKMGMHASDTGELSFQDVRVPAPTWPPSGPRRSETATST